MIFLEIKRIEFDHYGKNALQYLEKDNLWQGYLRLNGTQQFKFQVKNNTFFLLDEYRKGDAFSHVYIKDREGLYEAALKSKDILYTSHDLLTFIKTLEDVKNAEKLEIQSHEITLHTEGAFFIDLTLKEVPLYMSLNWSEEREGQTVLDVIASLMVQGRIPYSLLQTNKISDFIGEQKIRTLWKEVIKNEKNRLRLSNFSII